MEAFTTVAKTNTVLVTQHDIDVITPSQNWFQRLRRKPKLTPSEVAINRLRADLTRPY